MRRPGYTLIELLFALLVLGTVLAISLPPLLHWRDEAAVRSARDELSAGLARARLAAASNGGAALVLDAETGRFWTELGGERSPAVDLGRRYGVLVEAGSAGPVRVRYDALGIGRGSNRTIRLRRRDAEAGVTVGLYGRTRRW